MSKVYLGLGERDPRQQLLGVLLRKLDETALHRNSLRRLLSESVHEASKEVARNRGANQRVAQAAKKGAKLLEDYEANEAKKGGSVGRSVQRVIARIRSVAGRLRGSKKVQVGVKVENGDAEAMRWARRFPISEMWRNGYDIDGRRNAWALLDFFDVETPVDWEQWCRDVGVRFRGFKKEPDRFGVAAWLRQSQLVAERLDCKDYDPRSFDAELDQVRNLTFERDFRRARQRLLELCRNQGVAVSFVCQVKGLNVGGAVGWITKTRPAVHMTDRHKTHDLFWFNFFHEAAHVLRHPDKSLVESNTEKSMDDENEANLFAEDILIPRERYEAFRERFCPKREDLRSLPKERIVELAEDVEIDPGCVVGRLKHEGMPRGRWRYLQRRVSFRRSCCFVSYSKADEPVAERLCDYLHCSCVGYWFAPEEIRGGDLVEEEIEKDLARCDKVLVLVSKASLINEWVAFEVSTAAQQQEDLLVPLLLIPRREIEEYLDKASPLAKATWDLLKPRKSIDLLAFAAGHRVDPDLEKLVEELGEGP